MNKTALLEKLRERYGAESDVVKKEKLDNICNLLKALPEFDVAKEVPEIYMYLDDGASRLDGDILSIIIDKLKNRITDVEIATVGSINSKKKRILYAFLSIIIVFVVAALVFTVLNFIYGEDYCNGLFGKIAGAFGTLDFALGATGFIWERIEDVKKNKVQLAARAAREARDNDENFVTIINKVNGHHNSVYGKVVDKHKEIDKSKHYHR